VLVRFELPRLAISDCTEERGDGERW
jgi:hypothetical protein